MGKINRKTLDGVLFIKAIGKLCVLSMGKYSSIRDRYICPIFLQASRCVQ